MTASVIGKRGSERWLPGVATAAILVLFAVSLGFANLRLRAKLRAQIAGRDAQVVNAIAVLEALPTAGDVPDDVDWGLEPGTGDPEVDALFQGERLREAVGRMKGVLGARLYDAQGALILGLPPELLDASLADADRQRLARFEPVSRFEPAVRRDTLFASAMADPSSPHATLPVLEVSIPMRGGASASLIGVAQLLLDGEAIAVEFAVLDRNLLREALAVFAVGGAALGVGLMWAFGRLRKATALLAERTVSLQRANEELAMAARMSALGAVMGHLLHGLKNPLAGLQQYMTRQVQVEAPGDDSVLSEAVRSTRRMQSMVQDVLRLLHEERSDGRYEITIDELGEICVQRSSALAGARRVTVRLHRTGEGGLDNRRANLVLLILENLLDNALEASPTGGHVDLSLRFAEGAWACEVADEGGGIPPDRVTQLFAPMRSGKPGGTGLGLALSKQLAGHLGGRLELVENGADGCRFRLVIPPRGEDGAGSGRTPPAT